MPKAYSLDLRERVIRFVESGQSRRSAAAHFEVSVSFVIRLLKTYQTSGCVTAKPGGGRRHAKLDQHRGFLLARIAEKDDITMPELAAELVIATDTKADPASLSRWFIRQGYRVKKNAAGQRTRSARCQTGTRGMDHHATAENAA